MTRGQQPEVGDLVQNADGHQRVVTDIRRGQWVLRSVHGSREDPPVPPDSLTLVARRGDWR
ncbi:hypothetical protein [Streptacidiphilus sp. PAMC 29251]